MSFKKICNINIIVLLVFKALTANIVQGFGYQNLLYPVARYDVSLRDCPDSSENEIKSQTQISAKTYEITRRDSVSKACNTLLFGSTILICQPKQSEAACLMGDTSEECIGYYKVPLDDEAYKYFDTPEKLSKFAPDLKWVPPIQYPKTYKLARDELVELQTRVQGLRSPVLKGDLIDAGTEILRIVPRITVAGRVVIRSLNSLSDGPSSGTAKMNEKIGRDLAMSAYRSEVAHADLLGSLGEIDITIGQFLKGDGQLGALTVIQIEILSVLKEADGSFSELMKSIPISTKIKA